MLPSTSQKHTFNHWLTSSPSSDSPLSSPRLLLDLFPPEIRTHIAYLLSRGSQTVHLLALARTSPVQRAAAVSALRHRLVLPPVSRARVLDRWVDVFLHEIKELVFERGCFRDIVTLCGGLEPHFFDLCQMSTLRKVIMCDERAVLEAVKNSASIRDVKVYMQQGQPATRLLLQTLGSLDLKSLEIVCNTYDKSVGKCFFQSFLKLPRAENAISACCPGLLALHLSCKTKHALRRRYIADVVLWHNIPALRGLEAVTVHGEPPDEMLLFLDEMRSVLLHGAPVAFYGSKNKLVRRLAPRLTAIRTNDCFTEQHREELTGCVRLEELATDLQRGSEMALGKVIGRMEGLRRLTLQWAVDHDAVLEGLENLFVEGEDVVSLIVDSAKHVEELRLRRLRIPMGDIVSILTSVGGQLRELEVDVMGQEEEPLERLESLLMAVAMHCRGLRELTVTSQGVLLWHQLFGYQGEPRSVQLEAQTRKVDAVLGLVRRFVPALDVSDVTATALLRMVR